MGARNNWSEDELIVVLDLYHRKGLVQNDPEVEELARLTGRTQASIIMRLANYVHIDAENSGYGLDGIGSDARRVYRRWSSTNPDFPATASAARASLQNQPANRGLSRINPTPRSGNCIAKFKTLDPQEIERFHLALLDYVSDPTSVLLVRGRPDERRQRFLNNNGIWIGPTDNSPAWWGFSVVANRCATFDFSKVPTHMFDAMRDGFASINAQRYYVAHIVRAKLGSSDYMNWTREEAVARFVCNIHPINHFYVPMEEKRLAEEPQRIVEEARKAAAVYGELWDQFMRLAGPSASAYLDGLWALEPSIRASPISKPRVSGTQRTGQDGVVEYSSTTRLTFKAKVIEPLGWDDSFRTRNSHGTYQMTKREFYEAFPRIVKTLSYRVKGQYHGAQLHLQAERFRIGD